MKQRRSPRDDEWLACVLADTDALLSDHAHCEKKAAATALSLISNYPQHSRLVTEMVELAAEELGHFGEVHRRIVARGQILRPDEGDPYARALVGQVRGNADERLVDRLLVCGLIESRSHARLRLLAKHHPDAELREMFDSFGKAEARHGFLFVELARELGPGEAAVDARLAELTAFEERLVDEGPIRCAMH